jgi:glyoxylase-like metal-dependent hydrolase (beta-lactamase superfamily II)
MSTDQQTCVDTIELGDVEITRVVEWHSPIAPAEAVFPSTGPESWRRNQDWLAPHFWDPETTFFKAYVQTWVLRSAGRTILVDTGVGDDKYRPYMPPWSYLRTGFLDRLAAAGVTSGDVDVVVNTHVHADHVGWNTRLAGGEWVPTFPNADYLIAKADFEYWNPANGHAKRGSLGGISAELGNQNMFEDSVLPVAQHGKAVLWEDSYVLDRDLRLEPAPGHTPGSAVLALDSRGDRALFVGDLMHTPLQFVDPACEACLSEDEPAAVRQRRRYLERAADTNALVLPAHLPGPGAATVRRDGGTFAIKHWAPFSPVA